MYGLQVMSKHSCHMEKFDYLMTGTMQHMLRSMENGKHSIWEATRLVGNTSVRTTSYISSGVQNEI